MYQPKHFQETDLARIHGLIEAHSFGALIATRPGGQVEMAHLPFLLDRGAGPNGRLRAHVAKGNSIWELAAAGAPLCAVFRGPHCYVSPRWYERPDRQVPTWNYAVVEAHGRAEAPLPREELRRLIDDLAAAHERGSAQPWSTAELPPDLLDGLLEQIVGISLAIDRFDAKFKLSQNRSAADHARVVQALGARAGPDDVAVAELMTLRASH